MNTAKRANRDMIMLGGWLFADLLLGLAMLFLAANTVGTPPPSPTPTASPDLVATTQARADATMLAQSGQLDAANATATAVALNATQIAAAEATSVALLQAQQTKAADIAKTREAMSADEKATADALATQEAVAAEATIAAFATRQALSEQDVDAVTRQLATAAAQSTEDAISAQATISAQQTEAAEIALVATQNAESGANDLATAQAQLAAAQATMAAIFADQALSESARATAEAQATQIQGTIVAISTQQVSAASTATVLARAASISSIDPTKVELTIQVDPVGLLNGDQDAVQETTAALEQALAPYGECRAGLALTFGWSEDLAEGLAVADAVNAILVDDFPDQFGDAALDNFANLQSPAGQVDLEIYFYKGCEPTG